MNISQLKEKFLKHFEAPDEHETHDIHEGGFYNSTLVDTEDAVAEVFKGLENDTYKELVALLNQSNVQWVKKD